MADIKLTAEVDGIYSSILNQAKRAEKALTGFGRINLRHIEAPMGKISAQAAQFEKSLAAAQARTLSFGAALGALTLIEKSYTRLIKSTIDVERSLVDINVALNANAQQLQKFSADIFKAAKDTGQSFKLAADAALEFSRQGLGVEETAKRTRDALILVRRSGVDVSVAISGLTSIINGYNDTLLDSTEIVNKLVAVDQRYAVSAGDLVEAFTRVGSSAKDAGVDLDELIGLITSLKQTTGRNASVIGNSLKTIFTRLERPETLKTLEQIGVVTGYTTGNFRDATSVITDLAAKYKTLDDAGKAYISQLVGGVFQINQLKAALDDLGRGSLSTAARATEDSRKATDEALRGIEKLNQTLGDRINRLNESLNQAFANLGKGGLAKPVQRLVDIGQTLLDSINPKSAEDAGTTIGQNIAKGLGNFLAGPGLLVAGTLLTKLIGVTAQFATGAVKSFLGIGNQATKIRDLQVQINSALQAQGTSYAQILKESSSRIAAESAILRIIQAQVAAQRDLAGGAGASLYSKGLRFSGDSGFYFRGKSSYATPGSGSVRRAVSGASGLIPAIAQEVSAVNRAVGGASPGARPVIIENFKFGGGKTGPVVANTDEKIVRNYAQGADAIFNPEMERKYGTPRGAVNLAGGYSFRQPLPVRKFATAFKVDSAVGDLIKREVGLRFRNAAGSVESGKFKVLKVAGDQYSLLDLKMRGELESLGLSRIEAEKRAVRSMSRKDILSMDYNESSFFAKGYVPLASGFQKGNPYRFKRQTAGEFLPEVGELGYANARAKLEKDYKLSPGLNDEQFLENVALRRNVSVPRAFEYVQKLGQRLEKQDLLRSIPTKLTPSGPGGTLTQHDIDDQRLAHKLSRELTARKGRPADVEMAIDAEFERGLAKQIRGYRERGNLNLDYKGFLQKEGLPQPKFLFQPAGLLGQGGSYPITPYGGGGRSGPPIFIPPGGGGSVPLPPDPKPAPNVAPIRGREYPDLGYDTPRTYTDDPSRGRYAEPVYTGRVAFNPAFGGRSPGVVELLKRRREEGGRHNLEGFSTSFLGGGERTKGINAIRNTLGSNIGPDYFKSVARVADPANLNFTEQFEKQFKTSLAKFGPSVNGFARALEVASKQVQAAGASTDQVKKATASLLPGLVQYQQSVRDQNKVVSQFFQNAKQAERFQRVSGQLGAGQTLNRADRNFYNRQISQQVLERQIGTFESQTGQSFANLNPTLQRRLRREFAANARPLRNETIFEQNLASRQTRYGQEGFGAGDLRGLFGGNRQINREIRALQDELKASGRNLTTAQRTAQEDRLGGLKATRRANFGGRLQSAGGLGVPLATSLAAGQFEDSSVTGAGLRGASVGSLAFLTGNPYAGIAGTLIGGITNAINQYAENQKPSIEKLTVALENNSAAFSQSADAFQQYIQLNQQLQEGTREGSLAPIDVLKLQRRRDVVAGQVANPELQAILGAPGLSDAERVRRASEVQFKQQNEFNRQDAGNALTKLSNAANTFEKVYAKSTPYTGGGIPGISGPALPEVTGYRVNTDDKDNVKALEAIAQKIVAGNIGSQADLDRFSGLRGRLSDESLNKSPVTTKENLRAVAQTIFGANAERERSIDNDTDRQRALFLELLTTVEKVGKTELESAEARGIEAVRLLKLSREIGTIVNSISEAGFAKSLAATRAINNQSIGLARGRGAASLYENSFSPVQSARLGGALDVRQLGIERQSAQLSLQRGGLDDLVAYFKTQEVGGKEPLEAIEKLVAGGTLDPLKIIDELRKGNTLLISEDQAAFEKVVNQLKRNAAEFDENFRTQEALLRENNRIQEEAARRSTLRGFVGGQSPLDVFRQTRSNPDYLKELFGNAGNLPGLSIRNERNARRGRFDLNSVADEAVALADQQKLLRQLNIKPTPQQQFRFGAANRELGVNAFKQLFASQLESAGASKDILGLAGTGDVRNIDKAIGRVRGRAQTFSQDPSYRNQLSVLENFRSVIPQAGEAGKILSQDLSSQLINGIGGGATNKDIVDAITNNLDYDAFVKRLNPTTGGDFAGITTIFDNLGRKVEGTIELLDQKNGTVGFTRGFDAKAFEIPLNRLAADTRAAILDIAEGRDKTKKEQERKGNLEVDLQLKKEQIEALSDEFFKGFAENLQQYAKVQVEKSLALAISSESVGGKQITAEEYDAIIAELTKIRGRLFNVERKSDNKIPAPPTVNASVDSYQLL